MNETTYAAIVIDDPLLKPNYGFLNYQKLLECMDQFKFHTSIAFIPWNYKRTDCQVASMMRERPDRFSLCVHGCDHTRGEFGSCNKEYLISKIKLATSRMRRHEQLTGLGFDRVMIFPQGIYSNEALEALAESGYLAAVNTTIEPIAGNRQTLLPFFARTKPEDINNADDKYVFIVIHHDYFRYGYESISKMVQRVNALYENVVWCSLGESVRKLGAKDRQTIEIDSVDLSGLSVNGLIGNTQIRIRRYMSEIRDNIVSRSGVATRLYQSVENS